MRIAEYFLIHNLMLYDAEIAGGLIKSYLPKPKKGEKFINFKIQLFPDDADNFLKNVSTLRIIYDRYKAPRIALKKSKYEI